MASLTSGVIRNLVCNPRAFSPGIIIISVSANTPTDMRMKEVSKWEHVKRTFTGLYVIGGGFVRDWAWFRTWQRQLTLRM